ncbi:AAA family ATPase [Maridesulfovibrio sp.]|uniref:AAA family ATPase n=1 Tax=Maridesulfovibrio sp. TaxID=2795000 RepID=UPI002AA80902|nr:AAA family ATPase [Maridesulfovibrio sp.]
MIRAEYQRFMQTLVDNSVSDDVRKIANLVLFNLDTLIPLSTARGQRIIKIVELAQLNWDRLSTQIHTDPVQVGAQTSSACALKKISVGPFRGFAQTEEFDLSNKIVLMYGPNGTGKSSFCEALEYGLLGSVAEADNKRFRDQNKYLKNAYTNNFEAPEIIGDNDTKIIANEPLYRFCFVEKNRIDNFSRIAAQAPAKQGELISTLFGMDAFNSFVRNFSAEMGNNHIDVEGLKSKELSSKEQSLAGARAQKKEAEDALKRLAGEEQNLANQYRAGLTFPQMEIEINGNGEKAGAISLLENELAQPVNLQMGLSLATLQSLGNSIRANVSDLASKQQILQDASEQVSFKNLYEAVRQTQNLNADICPACKTPLTSTVVNPYTHASSELKKLQHLAQTQGVVEKLRQDLNVSLNGVSHIINSCCTFYSENVIYAYRLAPNSQVSNEWWNSLNQSLPEGGTPWQHLESQVKQIEDNDKEIDQIKQIRAKKQQDLNILRQYNGLIIKIKAQHDFAQQRIVKSQKTIENFNIENAQLISEAKSEQVVVKRNISIASSYADFVVRLNAYKNDLPIRLVADLSVSVVALYNAFNRNDAANERLAEVYLPLAQNQRLEISFENDPAKRFDALHILSEGHIRCLGLAILMAKNLKENCSLLIFDDPVNAIDDDHKEAIRRTLFEDDFFNEKQIILACHGEEFFKDIQNLLPREVASQAKLFSFLPRLGEQHVRVDPHCRPRNYIIAANDCLDRGEIRNALAKSRQALESLTKGKVWRYVNKYGDSNLSIKMRSATSPIELYNLTTQLKSKIAKNDFGDSNKFIVLTPLDTLLGMNGNSREWRYLNKGTHDEADRAEFDRSTVIKIVSMIEALDSALQ